MSFFTTITFARPQKPPRITGKDLARFLDKLFALGLVDADHSQCSLQLRFGERIDSDDKGVAWEEEESEIISTVHSIKFDVDQSDKSPRELLAFLRDCPQSIYRAFIDLGPVADSLLRLMEIPKHKTGERGELALDSWSLSIGPVLAHDMQSESAISMGWLGLSISGNGQIYPWTWPELAAHLESLRDIRFIMDLCRSTWPVPSLPPDAATIRQREEFGALWPYPKALDRPWDWLWVLQETG